MWRCAQIGYAPFALGTLAGMSGWSLLYASLGGASRVLLDSGMDMGMLIEGAPACTTL